MSAKLSRSNITQKELAEGLGVSQMTISRALNNQPGVSRKLQKKILSAINKYGYVPNHTVNMVFLGTSSSGDWALGDFWGPFTDETRTWLDHLATGRPCIHTNPEQARTTLEVTLAIEKAVQTKEAVKLPLLK